MNDIEENRAKLRDLALHHIEPSPKVEHDDDSDAPSLGSHNTPSQRKHQRGGRKHDTFPNGSKTGGEFEYIDPTPTNEEPFEAANSLNNDEEIREERKHQRGGRKNKRSTRQDLESQKPWSQRNGRLRSPYPEEEEEEEEKSQTTQDAEEPTSTKPAKVPTPFETGIKAFNLRRAEQSGGRPVGVSVDRGEKTNGERIKKEKKSKKSKKKSKKSKKREESSSDENSSSSSESEEDEKEKRKPLAIRLDLNLELEIFLRAKIKGDITVTFLE